MNPPSKRSSAPGASLRQAAGTQKPSPRARRAAAAATRTWSFIVLGSSGNDAAHRSNAARQSCVGAWRCSRSSFTRASARAGQNSAAVRAADSALHLNMKYKLSLVLRRAAARARKETVYHYTTEPQLACSRAKLSLCDVNFASERQEICLRLAQAEHNQTSPIKTSSRVILEEPWISILWGPPASSDFSSTIH